MRHAPHRVWSEVYRCGACLSSSAVGIRPTLTSPMNWLSATPLRLVLVLRPYRPGCSPYLRSSLLPARPLRLLPIVLRTRQPPRHGRRAPAPLLDTSFCAPTGEPAPASCRPLRFPGRELQEPKAHELIGKTASRRRLIVALLRRKERARGRRKNARALVIRLHELIKKGERVARRSPIAVHLATMER